MISHIDTFVFGSKLDDVYHHINGIHAFTGFPNVITLTFHSSTSPESTQITALLPPSACKVIVLEIGEFFKQRTESPGLIPPKFRLA